MAIVLPIDFCYTCETQAAVARVKFHDDGAVFYFCTECLSDCVNVIDAFNIDAEVTAISSGVQTTLI